MRTWFGPGRRRARAVPASEIDERRAARAAEAQAVANAAELADHAARFDALDARIGTLFGLMGLACSAAGLSVPDLDQTTPMPMLHLVPDQRDTA